MRSASSDRNQQQEYRDDLLQQCKDVIAQSLSTCNRFLDDVTIRGLEDVETVSSTYLCDKMAPTPAPAATVNFQFTDLNVSRNAQARSKDTTADVSKNCTVPWLPRAARY